MQFIRCGWVVESIEDDTHLGMGHGPETYEWVGFNSYRLLVFQEKEEAVAFIEEHGYGDVAMPVEHSWG